MLTVTAVLAPPAYDESHLARLFALVVENINQPFVWQPVTDSPWRGWWSKVSLFEPGRFAGRTLFMDLDVTPCGALDDLAAYPGDLVACRDFLTLGINSSVMAWTPSERTERIYTEFTPDVMSRMHGDQNWIYAMMPDVATFPRKWVRSHKVDRPHPDQRVVVCHGHPKPWDVE